MGAANASKARQAAPAQDGEEVFEVLGPRPIGWICWETKTGEQYSAVVETSGASRGHVFSLTPSLAYEIQQARRFWTRMATEPAASVISKIRRATKKSKYLPLPRNLPATICVTCSIESIVHLSADTVLLVGQDSEVSLPAGCIRDGLIDLQTIQPIGFVGKYTQMARVRNICSMDRWFPADPAGAAGPEVPGPGEMHAQLPPTASAALTFHIQEHKAAGLTRTPIKQLVVPRCIAWVSSASPESSNLAPYSFFLVTDGHPKFAVLAIGGAHTEGGLKDTALNICESEQFVINVPVTWERARQMNATSGELGRNIDEAEVAGLRLTPTTHGPALEASAHIECTLVRTVELAPELKKAGADTPPNLLIIGLVRSVRSRSPPAMDPALNRPICRLGYLDYAVFEESDYFWPEPSSSM